MRTNAILSLMYFLINLMGWNDWTKEPHSLKKAFSILFFLKLVSCCPVCLQTYYNSRGGPLFLFLLCTLLTVKIIDLPLTVWFSLVWNAPCSLALNSPRPTCLCFLHAGTKGIYYYSWIWNIAKAESETKQANCSVFVMCLTAFIFV